MYVNPILVLVDGSAETHFAAQQAARMADTQCAPLHLVTVMRKNFTGTVEKGHDEWFLDSHDVAHQMLLALSQELRASAGINTAVLEHRPAKAICEEARRVHASSIVMGCPGSTEGEKSIRRVVHSVRRHSPCPVLVVEETSTGAVRACSAVSQSTFWPGFHVVNGHFSWLPGHH